MNLDYSDIFRMRGDRYHAAMLSEPMARQSEFEHLFDVLPVLPGQRVLDVPAGGGYLSRFLPRSELVALELTPGFGEGLPVVDPAVDWTVGDFDHVVCLAALHHIADQTAFVARLLSHVGRGGVLHLADVAHGSPLASFLDGFVGRFNRTGHEGRYLHLDALPLPPGAQVLRAAETVCPWHFPTRDRLLAFCMQLFGLDGCPAGALDDALSSLVGIRTHADGVSLDWRLLYVDVRPPTATCRD